MSKRRKRRSQRGQGAGFGKANASWAVHDHSTPGDQGRQVFRSIAIVAQHLRGNGRLAAVFALTPAGRIDDEAIVMHGGELLGIVPVLLLSRIADALPSLDTTELRQTIATYQAEQAGWGGRA